MRLSLNGASGRIIHSSNHVGTHLDEECLLVYGGQEIAPVPPDRLQGPGFIVRSAGSVVPTRGYAMHSSL